MPFLAQQHVGIPTKDIISWCYEHRSSFDQDKPIYIDCADPKRSISANQACVLIRRLVAGFRVAGLRDGDVVCIHAFNNLYYPILVQGIIASGGVFVGTNPGYTPFELTHALETSKARFVIAEPEITNGIREAALQIGLPKERVLTFAEPDAARHLDMRSWRCLLEHGEQDWLKFDDQKIAQNTPAFLLFSSGTTGLPKAAVLSHYNLVAQHTLVHENAYHPEPYHVSRIICLPMFHAAAAPYTHTSTLRSGRESYIMRRFAMPDFLLNLEKFQVTNMMLVPPMVVAITSAAAESPDREQFVKKCLRSVVAGVGGAAPLDKETQIRLQKLLPEASSFNQLWAMSETSCVASYLFHPENDHTASVGRFLPDLDVKLVDPDLDSATAGQEFGHYDMRGELCIRGSTVIRGYLDNPEANTRDWDAEGYFHTGDIMYCDGETKLWYVVDRRKELIKVRGFQVAPNEIEGVLLSHPSVQDVAVIGIPDTQTGSELPRAYVVLASGAKLKETEINGWVSERLARYKQLDGGVKFVDSIPKTASGKILKRVLRDQAKKEMDAKL